jgi:hypothetical protein
MAGMKKILENLFMFWHCTMKNIDRQYFFL